MSETRWFWTAWLAAALVALGSCGSTDKERCTREAPECPEGFRCAFDEQRCVPAGTTDARPAEGQTPPDAGPAVDGESLADTAPPSPGCGNGTVDPGEACDKTDLGGKTCSTLGFHGGTLSCKTSCTLDTSACFKCGDAKINGAAEVCDGTDLGGKTCPGLGFEGGTLACASDCTFDTSKCYMCGDGVKNGPTEDCDGTDLGGKTCSQEGFAGGALGCTSACTLDKSGCNSAGFSNITAGTFTMGSPATEKCRMSNEDQHAVTLTHDFEMQTTEVTQGQFQAVMGYNPSFFAPNGQGPICGTSCPVEYVLWSEAAAYCNALSVQRGLPECYFCSNSYCDPHPWYDGDKIYDCPGYRLPTEAEWEYAYRAGSQTALYNGSISNCLSDASVDAIAWYLYNTFNSGYMPRPVGQKAKNAWGMYDMAGNVSEWCHDRYDLDDGLGTTAVTNPVGPPPPWYFRVVRGGSYQHGAMWMRAASRSGEILQNQRTGFRVARTK